MGRRYNHVKIERAFGYAALPYKLIWFCYSGKDYEKLPEWLRENKEVVFVLPEKKMDMRSKIENRIEDKAEDTVLLLRTFCRNSSLDLVLNPRICSAIRFNIISI